MNRTLMLGLNHKKSPITPAYKKWNGNISDTFMHSISAHIKIQLFVSAAVVNKWGIETLLNRHKVSEKCRAYPTVMEGQWNWTYLPP